MKPIFEYLSTKVKPSTIKATNGNIWKIVNNEIKYLGEEADLNHIDVSEVTIFDEVFYNTPFRGDVSKWDVHNMRSARFMFSASLFNGDLSRWDVSNCKNFNSMFNMALLFEGYGLENFNVENAEDMSYMFHRKGNFTGKNICDWKIPYNINLTCMFKNCFDLETDLSSWDITNTSMQSEIFDHCYKMIPQWFPQGTYVETVDTDIDYNSTKANKDIQAIKKQKIENR